MGEVCGGDKGLDEERDTGLAGDVRLGRGGRPGVRPGGVLDEGPHGRAQLPGGEGEGVPQGDEVQGGGRVLALRGPEEEAQHEEEVPEQEEQSNGGVEASEGRECGRLRGSRPRVPGGAPQLFGQQCLHLLSVKKSD